MDRKTTSDEAAAIVAAAREATPTWQWERVEGDPRRRHGRQALGRIDIGGLSFQAYFTGVGNHWEIHWRTKGPTYDILRAFGGRAGVFRTVVICMRDMIGDFLANGHPDRVGMGCASTAHGRFYAEYFPSRAGATYSFQAVKGRWNEGEDEPSAFVIGVPRVPTEFESVEPVSSPSA